MAMIALLLSTAPLVAGPLLQNASERIELVSVKRVERLPLWSAETPHDGSTTIGPRGVHIVRTERQRLDGSVRWQVVYAVDCKARRLRRLSQPMATDRVGFAKHTPVEGEDGYWYPERPFTLASQLLQRVCPSGN
ncbi:MAG: hypothetical protein CBD15_002000 [Synechococcus sp. TMED155]|nr:MAG: hypothetical protein CBD15_002000 [Synechococcus sp. TMED155]